MKVSSFAWFLAGTAVGAMGSGMSHGMDDLDVRKMRRMKKRAAKMTTKFAHDAGYMISTIGETMARKMH